MNKKIFSKLLSCFIAVAMLFSLSANVMADPVEDQSGTEVAEQQEDKETDGQNDDKKPVDEGSEKGSAAQQDDKESEDGNDVNDPAKDSVNADPQSTDIGQGSASIAPVDPGKEEPKPAGPERENYTIYLYPGSGTGDGITISSDDPACVATSAEEWGDYMFLWNGTGWSFKFGNTCPSSFTAPDGFEFRGWDYNGGFSNTIILNVEQDTWAYAVWGSNGKAGDDIIWEFNNNSGTLTLSGTGPMYDFQLNGDNTAPWRVYGTQISTVVVSEGINSIGESAFARCECIYKVILPDSLEWIKDSAFYECSHLDSIIIPENVTEIGANSFRDCYSLTDIFCHADPDDLRWDDTGNDFKKDGNKTVCHVSPANLSGYSTSKFSSVNVIFEGNLCGKSLYSSFDEELRKLSISGSGNMFDFSDSFKTPWDSYKENINYVYMDYAVTNIGNNAFKDCIYLLSFDFPDQLVNIGDGAFYGCSSFFYANFPDSLKSIGSDAFRSSGIRELNVTKNIVSIGDGAFKDCSDLQSVHFYCTKLSIGKDAFYGCINPPALYVESGMTADKLEWNEYNCDDFSQDANKALFFVGPSRLQAFTDKFSGKVNVDFREYLFGPPEGYTFGDNLIWKLDGDGILTISGTGDMPDYNHPYDTPWGKMSLNNKVTRIIIGDQVTGIGNYAFGNCKNAVSVTIPNSINRIGENAFGNCEKLEAVNIPGSVETVGKSAFIYCYELGSVTISNGVKSLGGSSFRSAIKLKSIVIPDSVTSIGEYAFENCSSLKSAALSKNIEAINTGLFQNCFALTSLVIPEGIKSIGNNAFMNCRALKTLSIPNSVTEIKDGAFGYCRNLSDVTFPNGMTTLGNYAFEYCSSLKSATLPDSITSIGVYAFENCEKLEKVILPANITSINSSAFYECPALKEITIPNGVTSIGDDAFRGCASLTSLIIPESVSVIENGAFNECTSLKTITVLSSSLELGAAVFWYDTAVTDVYFYIDPAKLNWEISYDFTDLNGRTDPLLIHVPSQYLASYQTKYNDYKPDFITFVGGAQNIDMTLGTHLYGYSLSLEGDIGVNFYLKLSDTILASESAKMVFTIPSGNSTVKETLYVKDVIAVDSNKVTSGNDTYYKFKAGVSAKDISQDIKAQMIDGDTKGIVYTFSVKQYADYLLAHESDFPAALPLVNAMLNYGAFAQDYFKINGTLVADTSKLSGVNAAVLSGFNNSNLNLPDGVSFYAASLSLKSGTTLSLYFESKVGNITLSCNGKTYQTETVGNYQVIRIRNIMASELDQEFTVSISASSGTGSMSYCPLKYCYMVVNDPAEDPALQNVCKALYLYYSAAKDYSN